MLIERARRIKGPSPRLDTVHRVERVLRDAARRGEGPLSYAEIERRLPVKKVRRQTLKTVLAELRRFHLISEDKKGVMWVLAEDDEVWNRRRVPLR